LADRNVYARGNREWMDKARVEIREGDVLQLPFPAEVFDLVAAVELHFWWPELPRAMREVLPVLEPGGTVVIYKGADTRVAKLAEKYLGSLGIHR
jgi:SAM-dependent methyltransferase